MAAAKAPQAQLITGDGNVSEELDGFVKATGLASWGLDYQARAMRVPMRARRAAACAAEADATTRRFQNRRVRGASQVVAIMGPQSSGKSTLLNHLFGTKFTEMDALTRRGQTTQARLRRTHAHEHPGLQGFQRPALRATPLTPPRAPPTRRHAPAGRVAGAVGQAPGWPAHAGDGPRGHGRAGARRRRRCV
jgi:hypothetical protein